MASNLISPALWQTIPFEDPDAWEDFLGQHQESHEVWAKMTQTAWTPIDLRIVGGGMTPEAKQKLTRAALGQNQQMHWDTADALGISRSGDLVSYDLTNRDQYVGWLWVHSLDHTRINAVLGI